MAEQDLPLATEPQQPTARAPFVPQTPQAKMVTPGPEERALESQYRSEAQGLDTKLAPLKAGMDRLSGEMEDVSAGMPKPPQFTPISEYKPQGQRSGDEMMLFAGIAMALSAIGSKVAGGDIATTMNTAGAAMDGLAKGDIQRAKQDIENFNTQQKAVVANNQRMLEEYQSVLADKRMTMQQKMQQYQIVAAKYQDEIALSAIKKGDIKFALDRETKLRDATNQFNQRGEQTRSMLEARLAAASRTDRGGPMNLTEDAINDVANYVVLNGRLPIGFARMGQEAQQAILNRVSEVARAAGMSSEELAAAGPLTKQKLGAYLQFEKMRNGIQAYEKMLDLNIDVLKELSAKVNRTGSPYANKGVLWLQQNASGDPDVAEYLFQVRTVQTEAARILSNPNLTGQLTDTATQELANVFGANLTHDQLTRVAERAQADARNRSRTIDEQSQKLIAEIKDPLKRNAGAPGGQSVQRSTSKSGRPIVSRDGGKTWEYE